LGINDKENVGEKGSKYTKIIGERGFNLELGKGFLSPPKPFFTQNTPNFWGELKGNP